MAQTRLQIKGKAQKGKTDSRFRGCSLPMLSPWSCQEGASNQELSFISPQNQEEKNICELT